MQLIKHHLYQENPTEFVQRLPFISTEEYGQWLLQMSHIEGLSRVDDVVFPIPGSNPEIVRSDRFSKVSLANIESAYNKVLGLNFVGFAWLELIRSRTIIPKENEVEALVAFIEECSGQNNPLSIPFEKVDELFEKLEACDNFDKVSHEIRAAFQKQFYSTDEYERMITAITDKKTEFFPTQNELLKFYSEHTN